jgi:TolB protein
MSRIPRTVAIWLLACLAAMPLVGAAQNNGPLELDIVGGRASALPIAVAPFGGTGGGTDIAAIIRADLDRSGQFRTMPEADVRAVSAPSAPPTQGAEVQFPAWAAAKQDFLLVGRVVDPTRIEYELFDVAKQQRLLGYALSAQPSRDIAHQIADAVYEKILGVRGAFWTRMAYVTASGLGRNTSYTLVVADSDGANPNTVVRSNQPLLSPAWSPDGSKLAYVSFESGNSAIYVQDLSTGAREVVSSFRGINGAPSFSPDGRRLAMSLSKNGNPDIYVMDLGSRGLTRITDQLGIDTEPTWSADGATLYFTSDRGGRPQIYQAPASGGGASRVTFQGSYNASPTVSADGKKIAVLQGAGNDYRVAMLDRSLGSPQWTRLSPGSQDESPSFAPNGAMLLYAARGGVFVVSADGRVRQQLVQGAREPAWGPFRQQR